MLDVSRLNRSNRSFFHQPLAVLSALFAKIKQVVTAVFRKLASLFTRDPASSSFIRDGRTIEEDRVRSVSLEQRKEDLEEEVYLQIESLFLEEERVSGRPLEASSSDERKLTELEKQKGTPVDFLSLVNKLAPLLSSKNDHSYEWNVEEDSKQIASHLTEFNILNTQDSKEEFESFLLKAIKERKSRVFLRSLLAINEKTHFFNEVELLDRWFFQTSEVKFLKTSPLGEGCATLLKLAMERGSLPEGWIKKALSQRGSLMDRGRIFIEMLAKVEDVTLERYSKEFSFCFCRDSVASIEKNFKQSVCFLIYWFFESAKPQQEEKLFLFLKSLGVAIEVELIEFVFFENLNFSSQILAQWKDFFLQSVLLSENARERLQQKNFL